MEDKDQEIELVSEYEELEYDLSSIGLNNIFLVNEGNGLIYFYKGDDDFYLELSKSDIISILTKNIIVIHDDESSITMTEEQSEIVKGVLSGFIKEV